MWNVQSECRGFREEHRLKYVIFRCRNTFPVVPEEFKEAKMLECPLKCDGYWCKDCNQVAERGKVHSCDGQSEFDQLVLDEKLKRCPGPSLAFETAYTHYPFQVANKPCTR